MMLAPFADLYRLPFRFFLGILGAFTPFVSLVYLPTIPSLTYDLGCSNFLANTTVGFGFIGASLSQLFWGPLSDYLTRKNTLLISLSLTCVASIVCFLSRNIYTIIVSFFVLGFSSAGNAIITRAICRDLYHEKYLDHIVSWLIMVSACTSSFAPLLGSFLSARYGWPSIFLLLCFLSLFLIVALAFILQKYSQVKAVIDFHSIIRGYNHFLLDPKTLLLSLSSMLLFVSFYACFSGTCWLYNHYFELEGRNLSLYLSGLSIALFLGGMLQAFGGVKIRNSYVIMWCWFQCEVSLCIGLLLIILGGEKLHLVYTISVTLGVLSTPPLSAIFATETFKRHGPEYAGALSSFMGAMQFLGCLLGSFIANFTRTPLSILICFAILMNCTVLFYVLSCMVSRKDPKKRLLTKGPVHH